MKMGILVVATLVMTLGLTALKAKQAIAQTLEVCAQSAIALDTSSELQSVLDG